MIWKKLPELKVGDIVPIRGGTLAQGATLPQMPLFSNKQRRKHQCSKEINTNLAWLLGALVGDGNYSDQDDGRVEFSNLNKHLLALFSFCAQDCFHVDVTIRGKKRSKNQKRRRVARAYFHSRYVRDYLYDMGLEYETGSSKQVPWIIRQSPLNSQISFLQGLFDTDGGVNRVSIHLTTTSDSIAKVAQLMLLNLGIFSQRVLLREETERWATAWRVYITGRNACRFTKIVGFRHVEKQKKAQRQYGQFKTKVPKANRSFIPGGKELIGAVRKHLMEQSLSKVYLKTPNRTIYQLIAAICRGERHLSTEHLPLLAQYMSLADCGDAGKTLDNILRNNIFFDVVRSIGHGQCEMLDLYVPDGHDFVGNGFINHNSQGKTLDQVGVNLNDHFENGMTYVALSRCRRLDGLYLCGCLPDEIKVDREAIEFLEESKDEK
jgi:intein/homing endonuclease